MNDSISIKKIWEDVEFMKVQINCQSSHVKIQNEYYIGNHIIEDLIRGIKLFLTGGMDSFLWLSGEKGNNSTACCSFDFVFKDKCGHILIDVFMELDDGSTYEKHNCCFFINTEYGQLEVFANNLQKIFDGDIGTTIVLGLFSEPEINKTD